MLPRIYIETSVFGGMFDSEFEQYTAHFFELLEKGGIYGIVSDLTLAELENSPEYVRNILNRFEGDMLEFVVANEASEQLAFAYVKSGVVTKKSLMDARHVALATAAYANAIVSWNFKHIVNYSRIHKYNAINKMQNYPEIDIVTPQEFENE